MSNSSSISKSVIQCTGPLEFAFHKFDITTLKIAKLNFSQFTDEETYMYPLDVKFNFHHHYGLSLYLSSGDEPERACIAVLSWHTYHSFWKMSLINNTGHTGLYQSNIFFCRESDVKFIGSMAQWATVILASKSTMKFQQTAELQENKGKVQVVP